MIDVPSILIVAPSGIVNEERCLSTPIFSSNVSIFSGIVALLVAVEKAKSWTGKNFFTNFTGESLAKTASNIWYTPKHWSTSAITTQPMYLSIGTIASKPSVQNVLAISANTPNGATFITIIVISIMMSLNCVRKFVTVCTFSPSCASINPTNIAKKITASMFPSARAPIGFFGIMFRIVSATDVGSLESVVSVTWTADISRPSPGPMRSATPSATATAIIVVTR